MSSETQTSSVPERLRAAILQTSAGEITKLADLKSAIAPTASIVPAPDKLPAAPSIDDAELEAINQLVTVFGSVTVDEVRLLSDDERFDLMVEHETLGTVEKLAKSRKDGIRTMLLNHFTARVNSGEVQVDDLTTLARDKDGFPLLAQKVSGVHGKVWSAEPREGSVDLDLNRLKAIAADDTDDRFTHSDWLAITTSVRVVDENKLMLHLRTNPDLVAVLAEGTTRGTGSIAVAIRKDK